MRTALAFVFLLICCGRSPAVLAAVVPIPATTVTFGFPSGRIVGGEDARPHIAPWLVSMQWGFFGITEHLCGGSIIAANWVLTAGHCVLGVPELGDLHLVAGRHQLNANEDATEQRRIVDRDQILVHELYDTNRGVTPFDIALMRVTEPFDLRGSAAVRAIALPPADRLHSGSVDLHGWGSISPSPYPWEQEQPDVLQTIRIAVLPPAECRRALDFWLPTHSLHETNVCTGPLTGGVSPCHGDSGGPLSQNGTELVGVVSWGIVPCGSRNAPAVYGRVSAFIEWIEETRQRNGY